MKQDPVKDWPVDDAITLVRIKCSDLKARTDLSVSERSAVSEALRILLDAEVEAVQRLKDVRAV